MVEDVGARLSPPSSRETSGRDIGEGAADARRCGHRDFVGFGREATDRLIEGVTRLQLGYVAEVLRDDDDPLGLWGGGVAEDAGATTGRLIGRTARPGTAAARQRYD